MKEEETLEKVNLLGKQNFLKQNSEVRNFIHSSIVYVLLYFITKTILFHKRFCNPVIWTLWFDQCALIRERQFVVPEIRGNVCTGAFGITSQVTDSGQKPGAAQYCSWSQAIFHCLHPLAVLFDKGIPWWVPTHKMIVLPMLMIYLNVMMQSASCSHQYVA